MLSPIYTYYLPQVCVGKGLYPHMYLVCRIIQLKVDKFNQIITKRAFVPSESMKFWFYLQYGMFYWHQITNQFFQEKCLWLFKINFGSKEKKFYSHLSSLSNWWKIIFLDMKIFKFFTWFTSMVHIMCNFMVQNISQFSCKSF